MAFTFTGQQTAYNKSYYKPKTKLSYFHQMCVYKDAQYNKYLVRTSILDESYNIIDIKTNYLTGQECKKLISQSSDNELKLYSTNNLDQIGLPNCDDLIKTQSELLR
jgi:hypothetical protein